MVETETDDGIRELDPFGFLVGHRSAITPLGGETRGPDPRYVFHTPYLVFRPGKIVFTIRFDGLRASRGELHVHINAFVPDSGRDAMFVNSSRLILADAAANGGALTMSILGVAGATYALHGFCPDGTDAGAASLTVTAAELGMTEGFVPEELLSPTRYGVGMLQTPAALVSNSTPLFCDPISQPMTPGQLGETAYRERAAVLPGQISDERARWRLAFILQALDRFGMLRPGARGLSLWDGTSPLAALLTAAGCPILAGLPPVAATDGDASLDALRYPDICPDRMFDVAASSRVLSSLTDLPADLRGFDFLWSIGTANHARRHGGPARFIDEAMKALRPGGYAIHLFDIAMQRGPSGDSEDHAPLSRPEVERLAVTLLSRSHNVAQLNFEAAPDDAIVPFGLIVQKR